MGRPAARVSDLHVCSAQSPATHNGGALTGPGEATVLIEGLPAVRVGAPTPPAAMAVATTGTDELDVSHFRVPASTPFTAGGASITSARRDAQLASDHILAARARAPMAPPVVAGGADETVLGAPLQATPSLPFDKRTRYAPTSGATGPATPFQASSEAAPPPAARAPQPSSMSGRTVVGSSFKRQSLPFRRSTGPASAPPVPGWDVLRYGRLCIDLVRGGKEESFVLADHGISRDQRRALDRYWEERMLGEPEIRLEWKRACDARVEELDRGRG